MSGHPHVGSCAGSTHRKGRQCGKSNDALSVDDHEAGPSIWSPFVAFCQRAEIFDWRLVEHDGATASRIRGEGPQDLLFGVADLWEASETLLPSLAELSTTRLDSSCFQPEKYRDVPEFMYLQDPKGIS